MKSFRTIDEQIELLKSRNLIITDEKYAKNYLLSNNYYSIINGYGKYFPRNGEKYVNGTTFEELECLHRFDRDLKQVLFRAIVSVETHLKSIFAYHFAEKYRGKVYAYLNIECYDRSQTLSVISTIARLSQIIKKQQEVPNTSISHYVNQHNDVPIWVLMNYLDFGGLRCMMNSSSSSLKNSVAKDLQNFAKQNLSNVGIFPPEVMMSFVENIHEVRNVCAHNNRLLDFQCKRDSKYWNDLHKNYGIQPTNQRRDVFNVFISTQCFLSRMEYSTLHNSILKLMKDHLKKIKSIPIGNILVTLGFPGNWDTTSKIDHHSYQSL